MGDEWVKLLADAPVYVVLVYLLIKETNKNQQLLTAMIEREACHAKDMLELALHCREREEEKHKTVMPPLN